MTLQISWGAEQDGEEAVSWYDAQREGLGAEFLDELQHQLEIIESAPLRFPKLPRANDHRQIRQAILRRFPYRVIFETKEDLTLLVLAVAHTSRHADYWRGRPTT